MTDPKDARVEALDAAADALLRENRGLVQELLSLQRQLQEAQQERDAVLSALNAISPSLLNTPKQNLPVKEAIALTVGDVQGWLSSYNALEAQCATQAAQLRTIETLCDKAESVIADWEDAAWVDAADILAALAAPPKELV